MKNTINSANFQILIYKSEGNFTGICYETGDVEICSSIEDTKKHLINGVIATMKCISEGKLSEAAINRKPSLRYKIIFYGVILRHILRVFKKSSVISFSNEPISPFGFSNA